MSNGIGLEPMSKVLALVESGLVDVSIGPNPKVSPMPDVQGSGFGCGHRRGTRGYVVIEGRAAPFDPERGCRSPLSQPLPPRPGPPLA